MNTVAIYRLLYGSDFIGESLASIYDHVDKILCFVGHDAFGGRRVIRYFGHDVYLPHDIDGLTDAIKAWKSANDPQNKVEILPNPYATLLKGQLQRMVNDEVMPRHTGATHIFMVEADEVWHEDTINRLFEMARADTQTDEFMAEPHLFWRSPKYCSTRTNPYCVLRALKGKKEIGLTGHALMCEGKQGLTRRSTGLRVHNFGFAASARTIFWKHMTALSFSRDLNLDCPPRESWFEEVWRPWNWHTNRRTDLCPSIGYEHAFPAAEQYPHAKLPAIMQQRIDTRPLADWADADGPAGVAPAVSPQPQEALA